MVATDAKALFVDTNVPVYANVIETPFHEQVLAAINAAHQADRTLQSSRQIIREYLVTMARPQAFENLPRTMVLEQIGQLIERFQVADDTDAVTGQLNEANEGLQNRGKASPRCQYRSHHASLRRSFSADP